MTQYNGILLCKKPYKMSSHDVINNLRRVIGQKKIGHTGTLDPRATGLLVVCLGRATKISQFLTDCDKTYEVEITLGMKSSTHDAEGILDEPPVPVPELTPEEVTCILAEFQGKIMQKVPIYSAVKVQGKRLYKLARKGESIDTPEREIEVKSIELLKLSLPVVYCRVTCSKGTYIRTLAHDIGQYIGCGGYLSNLSRTLVGDYSLDDALTISEIRHFREAGVLKRYVRPIEEILKYPIIKVAEDFSPFILSGKSPRFDDIVDIKGQFDADELISLEDQSGCIMAVGRSRVSSDELENDRTNDFFQYVRVLN